MKVSRQLRFAFVLRKVIYFNSNDQTGTHISYFDGECANKEFIVRFYIHEVLIKDTIVYSKYHFVKKTLHGLVETFIYEKVCICPTMFSKSASDQRSSSPKGALKMLCHGRGI